MKLLKFNTILLLIILALGLTLRVYKLDSVPPGLTWDEASLGYNAYSISKTFRDEYGVFLPLTLKSFGDYKPALYAYLDIPFVMTLGLNEWAVRLPSVLAGVGFILLCYLITLEMFKDKALSLSVAFFASVSSLSIQFSRSAFESNVAVFLNILGLYLFLKALKSPKYYFASSIAFSLSLMCYQASKLFVPLIFIGIFLIFKNQIKFGKELLISLFFVGSIIFAIYFSTFFLGQSDRLAAQNFFAYRRSQEDISLVAKEDGVDPSGAEFQFMHGEWLAYVRGLVERYTIYFSPKTLFVDGDYSPRHSVPDMGILPWYGLLFFPLGFYFLWRKKEHGKKIIVFWLLTASIPAVLSRDLISSVRALNLLFPFVVIQGFGFFFLMSKLARVFNIKIFYSAALILLIVLINLVHYFDYYFVHLPAEYSEGWLYGYKQAIASVSDLSKYDRVVFTDNYGQPYIYYLFYTKYPPEKFQKQAILEQKTVDVGTVRHVDNIDFRPISWPADRGLERTLFFGTELEIPEQDIYTEKKSKKLSEIKFPDGKTAFKIIENGND